MPAVVTDRSVYVVVNEDQGDSVCDSLIETFKEGRMAGTHKKNQLNKNMRSTRLRRSVSGMHKCQLTRECSLIMIMRMCGRACAG